MLAVEPSPPQMVLQAPEIGAIAGTLPERRKAPQHVIPIGSLHTGWALKVDGVLRRSSPSLISLGAYVDAIMAGASEVDADNIARAIEVRPWPTYEERMAVFSPAGPWKPSRDPFESTLPPSETSRTAPSLRGEASERLYSRRRATPSHMVRPKHAQIFGKTAALDGQQPADLGR
jgi:hypothetical protein